MREPIPPWSPRGRHTWKLIAALSVFLIGIAAYLIVRAPGAEDAEPAGAAPRSEEKQHVYTNRAVWRTARAGAPLAAHIRGTVYDQRGRPIPGARVTAATFELAGNRSTPAAVAQSDGDGRFDLALADGSYYLTAEREGYGPAMAAAQGNDEVGLVLPRSGAVKGRVLDEQGMPVRRFALDVLSPATDDMAAPSPFSSRRIDSADGTFTLTELPDRSVYLRVTAPGYAPALSDLVRADPGESHEVEFKLSTGCSMTGVVRDAEGAPLAGVAVSAELRRSAGAMGTWSIDAASADESGDDGSFVLDGVPLGEVTVRAHDGDHAVSTVNVNVERCEGLAPLELRMKDGSGLSGVVRDASGKSLPGVRLTLSQRAIGFVNTTTDAEGRYRFERLPSGGMRLEAMRGEQHTTALVTIPEGEIAQKDLVFSSGGKGQIQGRITAGDRPVAGMALILLTNGGNGMLASHHLTSEADGTFQAAGLADGNYAVLVESMSRVTAAQVEQGGTATVDIDISKPKDKPQRPEMPAKGEDAR